MTTIDTRHNDGLLARERPATTLASRLTSIRNLYANPVRSSDPPVFSAATAAHAAPFWRACTPATAPARIPNRIHQPWLHGGVPKWEHVLGMIAAKFIARPQHYFLYYDRLPPRTAASEQWRCACALAECIHRPAATHVRGQRIRMGHWPEIMRYDLLLSYGGIFLDHDAYALTALDDLRSCCAATAACDRPAAVIAGFEQEDTIRKLNPGALMAEPNAAFLRLWRASWANYSSSDWDYNCCQVSYRLHAALGARLHAHLRADLGPLPRYGTEAEYDTHLQRARVVHVTALSQPWRRRDSITFGIMAKVSRLVLRRVSNATTEMNAAQRRCVELTTAQMQRRHARPGERIV